MGPEYLVVAAILGVVLVLAIAFGLVLYGASTRSAEIEILEERIKDLVCEIEREQKKFRVWARGASAAAARDRRVDSVAGDLDGLLRVWADEDADGAPPPEQSNPPPSVTDSGVEEKRQLGGDSGSPIPGAPLH